MGQACTYSAPGQDELKNIQEDGESRGKGNTMRNNEGLKQLDLGDHTYNDLDP
jgi:hypothetical protein